MKLNRSKRTGTCKVATEKHEQQEFLHRNVSQRFSTVLRLDVCCVALIVTVCSAAWIPCAWGMFPPTRVWPPKRPLEASPVIQVVWSIPTTMHQSCLFSADFTLGSWKDFDVGLSLIDLKEMIWKTSFGTKVNNVIYIPGWILKDWHMDWHMLKISCSRFHAQETLVAFKRNKILVVSTILWKIFNSLL